MTVKRNGRTRGAENRDTTLVKELLEKLGCVPMEILAHFAMGNHEALGLPESTTKSTATGETYEVLTITAELRQKSAKEICDFVYPKRKAVEIINDSEVAPPQFTINLVQPEKKD